MLTVLFCGCDVAKCPLGIRMRSAHSFSFSSGFSTQIFKAQRLVHLFAEALPPYVYKETALNWKKSSGNKHRESHNKEMEMGQFHCLQVAPHCELLWQILDTTQNKPIKKTKTKKNPGAQFYKHLISSLSEINKF